MKIRNEVVRGVISKITGFFEPELLHESVYSNQAEVIFRRDGRTIENIATEGGYVGREFLPQVKMLKSYVLINRPLIGVGGCINVNHAIEWGKNREPMEMHIHITDPITNKVINVPAAALRYQIGELSRDLHSSGKALTVFDVLAEQEHLTANDVLMNQFIASISKNHIAQLSEGVLVPNQLNLSGIDKTAPKVVSLTDLRNISALLLACIRANCLDKGEEIATKLEAERVLEESAKNGYETKTRQQLFCFWKAANPNKEAKMPEPESISVYMTNNKQ